MARTVFERNGGFASVSRVITVFYDKIVSSPVTSPYFINTDMRRLIDHQTRFIATIMGGPASYTNEHLERIHANLEITEAAFAEMVELLVETLEDFNFPDDDIMSVRDELNSRKRFIVTR